MSKQIRSNYRVQHQRISHLNLLATRKSPWQKTWENKLVAIFLVLIGSIPLWSGRDPGLFMLCYIIAVPLFFARRNWL